MQDDDTQHLDGPIAALTAAVLMAGVVMVLALVTACVVHIDLEAEPDTTLREGVRELVKPDATDALPVGSITQDGDSKDA